MNYKVGDILYVKRNNYWRTSDSKDIKVKANDAFIIIELNHWRYTKRAFLKHIEKGDKIFMNFVDINEDFITQKEMRLKKIFNLNGNH